MLLEQKKYIYKQGIRLPVKPASVAERGQNFIQRRNKTIRLR